MTWALRALPGESGPPPVLAAPAAVLPADQGLTDAKVVFHSCGAVASIIDDLIEMGVTV
jgi:hypothetical protein